MCDDCRNETISRRKALKFAAAGIVALGIGAQAPMVQAADGPTTSLTPDGALAALKEGNSRFIAHPELCTLDLSQRRSAVASGQAPWATVISCADSRVPPELVFGGVGLGELFVARNAGNLVDTATLGTVEYGAAVLGSPLIVVLAHTKCGAVAAACDVVTKNATYPGAIGPMIEPIIPAALSAKGEAGDFVNNTAVASARRTVERLGSASTVLSGLVSAGKLRMIAAIYDLESGKVSFL
jgi:carbonic anhydrase